MSTPPGCKQTKNTIIMHFSDGFTLNTFLTGLRFMLPMLDLLHNY